MNLYKKEKRYVLRFHKLTKTFQHGDGLYGNEQNFIIK